MSTIKKKPNHRKLPRFQTLYRTQGFSSNRTADAAGMWTPTHTHKEKLSLAQLKANELPLISESSEAKSGINH